MAEGQLQRQRLAEEQRQRQEQLLAAVEQRQRQRLVVMEQRQRDRLGEAEERLGEMVAAAEQRLGDRLAEVESKQNQNFLLQRGEARQETEFFLNCQMDRLRKEVHDKLKGDLDDLRESDLRRDQERGGWTENEKDWTDWGEWRDERQGERDTNLEKQTFESFVGEVDHQMAIFRRDISDLQTDVRALDGGVRRRYWSGTASTEVLVDKYE